jgi:hypothetical protein
VKFPWTQTEKSNRGLLFRGDTRSPAQIFLRGFSARDRSSTGPGYRYPHGDWAAPDVDPNSVVCITRDFNAAAIFPLSNPRAQSWIYVLDLPTHDVFNVQDFQYQAVVARRSQSAPNALWPMRGQERAVLSVSAPQIVCAVKIERTLNAMAQEVFRPLSLTMNPLYVRSSSTRRLVEGQMNAIVADQTYIRTPTRSDAVVAVR